jgi:hypothetical protein
VLPASQLRFTFDRAKAQSYLRSVGHPEVDVPERYEGASLVVSIPAIALLQYEPQANNGGGGAADRRSALIVGQAGEVTVGVEGNASLAELRDYFLSLPEGILPADTRDQLRKITDWQNTLPVPIPTDKVDWTGTTIGGDSHALLLNDTSGLGSAAMWQSGGHIFGVAGSYRAGEIERVANSLH